MQSKRIIWKDICSEGKSPMSLRNVLDWPLLIVNIHICAFLMKSCNSQLCLRIKTQVDLYDFDHISPGQLCHSCGVVYRMLRNDHGSSRKFLAIFQDVLNTLWVCQRLNIDPNFDDLYKAMFLNCWHSNVRVNTLPIPLFGVSILSLTRLTCRQKDSIGLIETCYPERIPNNLPIERFFLLPTDSSISPHVTTTFSALHLSLTDGSWQAWL